MKLARFHPCIQPNHLERGRWLWFAHLPVPSVFVESGMAPRRFKQPPRALSPLSRSKSLAKHGRASSRFCPPPADCPCQSPPGHRHAARFFQRHGAGFELLQQLLRGLNAGIPLPSSSFVASASRGAICLSQTASSARSGTRCPRPWWFPWSAPWWIMRHQSSEHVSLLIGEHGGHL